MASTRAHEIRVGIATVLAIVVIIAGIMWGKGGGLGVDNRSVQIRFGNVSGLDVGAPVTLNGVRKGSVTSLDATTSGVSVGIVVENSFAIKSDARALLMMQELTGGKKIELIPGSASSNLAPDAVIRGEVQGDIVALLSDLGTLGIKVTATIARVDSVLGALNSIVGAPEFRVGIKSTLANLESGSAAARELVVGNRRAINRIVTNVDEAITDVRTLVHEIRPAVERALNSVDTISVGARSALRNLETVLAHADTLVAHVDGVVRDLRDGKGLASKLLYDVDFAARLDSTINAVRILVRNIDRRGLNLNVGLGSKE